jgi:hypothetical protein
MKMANMFSLRSCDAAARQALQSADLGGSALLR